MIRVMYDMNDTSYVDDMSYVNKYELRYELCNLYKYFYESLKIK